MIYHISYMPKAFCTNHGVVRILAVLPTSVHKFNHDLLQNLQWTLPLICFTYLSSD